MSCRLDDGNCCVLTSCAKLGRIGDEVSTGKKVTDKDADRDCVNVVDMMLVEPCILTKL